ncbi:MAG: HNH endonuclease [Cetobacterium sp.]
MKSLSFIDEEMKNYYVTTCGRIYKKLKKGYKRLFERKLTIDGYPTLYIKTNSMEKCYSRVIHRVVALAFIPNIKNLETIDHINAIKTDNMVQNLRWASRSDQLYNTNYVEVKGVKVDCFKADGTFVKMYRSIEEAAKDGFSRPTIHKMIYNVPDLRWGRPYYSKTNKGHYFKLSSVTTIPKGSTPKQVETATIQKDKDIV